MATLWQASRSWRSDVGKGVVRDGIRVYSVVTSGKMGRRHGAESESRMQRKVRTG